MPTRFRQAAQIAARIAFAAGIAAPRLALADPTVEQKAAATVLFREARAMLESGDVPGACRRFEESHRLDPLPGTQLNMAVCHEREGRTATAWVELRDAAALARRDGRDDRVTLAEEHMKALEPRLSSVRIVVGSRADVPLLAVTLDGVELARPAWDTALPADPGVHVVGATAPSMKPFSKQVEVTREGETQTVSIDALEAAPPPPRPVAESASPPPVLATHDDAGLSSRRVVALAVGGAALVGIGIGTYFGLDAFAKHGDSNRECPANQCTPQGVTDNDRSKSAADASTIAFVITLPALAVATYLWISGGETSGASPPSSTALRVAPLVRRDGGGLSLGSAF